MVRATRDARTYVGGRLTVRTHTLRCPPVFKTGCRPLQRNLPDVSTRFERAASAFGRRRSLRLSYETALGFQLRIPIEIVHPTLVQMVRWECALGSQQLAGRRLPWRAPRLDPHRVALARVAGHAGRDDVRPGSLTTARSRDHVLERQFRGRKRLAAVLAREPVAQEHVE